MRSRLVYLTWRSLSQFANCTTSLFDISAEFLSKETSHVRTGEQADAQDVAPDNNTQIKSFFITHAPSITPGTPKPTSLFPI
ncbi:hypothetical protein BW685_23500 [Burkholderia ubonensis]|uniref:Uncharacterized protein n=1 Tax=Burkholderia ubonensis TaxID=101571 RepID=A0A1R1J7D7_9BURK|nr:hypothetical protein BW685_23500 [Burkholderia ubonensis]